MLFGNNYDVASIKKHYEKADNNFNMNKVKTSDKIPDKSVYMTKVFYKMYAVNSKAIDKLKKSKSATHLAEIDSTKGDYSRRKGNIGECIRNTYDLCKSLIKDNKDLKYTLFGVFCDTYDNLFNLKWRGAWKTAYDYEKAKPKSLATAFKMMYWTECYLIESLMLKISLATYKMYTGMDALSAVQEVMYDDRAYMDKVVFPGINLNTIISSAKDPTKMIKDFIAGDKQKDKAQENFENIEMSEEGAFWETLKKTGGLIGLCMALLLGGVGGGIITIATGGSAAVGVTAIVAGSIAFIFTIIPTIRSIIYYAYESEIDMVKELELNKELLENNIYQLKEKLKLMNDGVEKERLKTIIERQEMYYKKLEDKIAAKKVDSEACEYSMNNDEGEADQESDTYDNGNDSSDSDDGGDFSIEI